MHLLIIHSDQQITQSLVATLDQHGYQVQTSHFGDHAIALTQEYDIDLIILGVHLPDGYGFRILHRLNLNRNAVPVIIISSEDDLDTKVRALEFGADDYMTIPFEIEELEARIRAIARRSVNQDRLQHVVGHLR